MEKEMSDDIREMRQLRRTGAILLTGVMLACIVIIGVGAFWTGQGTSLLWVGIAVFAIPAFSVARGRTDAMVRLMLGITVPIYPALLLVQWQGTQWQPDLHMLFFALLATLTVLCDWRPIVAGTLVIAVHHLGANFLVPEWVFQNGADIDRVVLHAVIVLVEAAVLVRQATQLEQMIVARAEEQTATAISEREVAEEREVNLAIQQQVIAEIGAGLDALARGDLTARIEVDLDGSFGKLKHDYNCALASLSDAMLAVATSAVEITNGAGGISQASDDLARRTEQQAASLEETAAAMDEITNTVRKTATRAAQADQVVGDAREEADRSASIVSRAIEAMHNIEQSSSEISEIISIIDGIAFQTNLLALNAGVEAARAGDAGKGFAVVANEVRALAQRSADAARDVKLKITASAQQVDAGVGMVVEAGDALTRITNRIGEISTFVAEIAVDAGHQATALHQVNTAIGEMDGVTQENAAMVEEATAAAQSLVVETENMSRQVDRFNMRERGASPTQLHASDPIVRQLQDRVTTAASRFLAPRRSSRSATPLAIADNDWHDF